MKHPRPNRRQLLQMGAAVGGTLLAGRGAEALEADPLLVRRLRRLRASRQRQRSARRLGFEI